MPFFSLGTWVITSETVCGIFLGISFTDNSLAGSAGKFMGASLIGWGVKVGNPAGFCFKNEKLILGIFGSVGSLSLGREM